MGNRLLTTSRGTNLGNFSAVDWALFGSVGLIWGSSFLFMAIGLDSFHPGLVTSLRVWAAALFFAGIRRVRATTIEPGDRGRILFLSFTWVALPFTLFPLAQQWIDSGVAGMLNGTTPIFAAVLSGFLLRSLPTRFQMAGLALGLTGVALITLPGADQDVTHMLGVMLALIAAFSYGVSVTLAIPVLQKYGSLPVMGRMMWYATPVMVPYGSFAITRSSFSWPSLSATLAVGLLGTGLAFMLAGKLAGSVGSTRSAMVAYLIPVVAIVLGTVVRSEALAASALAGVALVILGAVLASRREARGMPPLPG